MALKKVEWLPFKFNLWDASFTKAHQDGLFNLVYDNQQAFPLHNKDLGFYNSSPTLFQQ